jgi:hypothetical protein
MAALFQDAQAVVEKAIEGDLIEVKRALLKLIPFMHWAVYVGDG